MPRAFRAPGIRRAETDCDKEGQTMSEYDEYEENDGRREETSGLRAGMSMLDELGSTYAGNEHEAFQCVSIIGQIEGHYVLDGTQKATRYDHLIPLFVSLEESDRVDGILIVINTMGGDVEAGLAIAEVIASLSKPTVSIVLGGGHSIGVPLAVAARRSFIVPSATMTLHPVRTTGTVISSPQSFDYLQKMQDRIVRFTVSHSHIREEKMRQYLMNTKQLTNDVGTVIDGEEAVASGLIDSIGGIREGLAALRELTAEARGVAQVSRPVSSASRPSSGTAQARSRKVQPRSRKAGSNE